MWNEIAKLASNLIGVFVDPVEVKKAKIERKVAKEKAKSVAELKKIEQSGKWEEVHAEGSKNSWKDEASLYTFLLIMICAFIPPLQPYILEGFELLEHLPHWFTNLLYIMICASFGIRVQDRAQTAIIQHKKNKQEEKTKNKE